MFVVWSAEKKTLNRCPTKDEGNSHNISLPVTAWRLEAGREYLKGKLLMASVQFGYDDLWVFYEGANKEVQSDLIKQLSAILKSCTEKMKKEVLKHAPEEAVALLWGSITVSWSNQELNNLFGTRR